MDAKEAETRFATIRKQWAEAGISKAPDTLKSLGYWVRDLAIAVVLYYVFDAAAPLLNATIGYTNACILSCIVQGTAWTGLWVIGHECGHSAFSANRAIETTVGYLTHTALLVPYFSWQYTHAKHHRYTNHLTKGETHVPATKSASKLFKKVADAVGEDAFAALQLFGHLVIGWPMYLFTNDTGGRTKADMKTRIDRKAHRSHFFPCQIFPPEKHNLVLISTVGCVTMIALMFKLHMQGFDTVYHYWAPYLGVNFWLVLYTWLQHTDPEVPHYGDEEFTWTLGALATIDRPYPWLVDQLHHHIGTTHVAHHLNYRIPHYRAEAATRIVKDVMGDGYNYMDSSIASAAWHVAKTCHYVDDVHGIQYLKSLNATKKVQ